MWVVCFGAHLNMCAGMWAGPPEGSMLGTWELVRHPSGVWPQACSHDLVLGPWNVVVGGTRGTTGLLHVSFQVGQLRPTPKKNLLVYPHDPGCVLLSTRTPTLWVFSQMELVLGWAVPLRGPWTEGQRWVKEPGGLPLLLPASLSEVLDLWTSP